MTETTQRPEGPSPETRRAVEVTEWRMVRELQKAKHAARLAYEEALASHDRAEELVSRAEQAIRERNRAEVAEWARGILDDPDALFLALATTGLEDPIDVVEVVVLGTDGETLLSERVRPAAYVVEETLDGDAVEIRRDPVEITPGAAGMHGRTAENLADAQTFARIYPRLAEALAGKRAVVYNAEYVGRVLEQTFRRYGLEAVWARRACAMESYSRVAGEWSVDSEEYYPVKLPGQDGTPEGNARALQALLKELADEANPEPEASSGGGGRRGGDVDLNEEDFEDIPFRHSIPARVRYSLIF